MKNTLCPLVGRGVFFISRHVTTTLNGINQPAAGHDPRISIGLKRFEFTLVDGV